MSEVLPPPPPSVPKEAAGGAVGGAGGAGGANASGAHGSASADGLPKRFGKYTLLRSLAKGGMAELFLALQKSVAGFEKLIVIKRILPSMNTDAAFIEMLLQEARTSATLSHPNIVQIFTWVRPRASTSSRWSTSTARTSAPSYGR